MGNPSVTEVTLTLKDHGGGVLGTSDPGTGYIDLAWDKTSTNTDASVLIDLKTFKLKLGRVTGVYTDEILMTSTTNKGALRYTQAGGTIGGDVLLPSQTLFAVVTTVNDGDTESANSSEFSFTTTSPPEDPDNSSFTEISTLPFTTTGSGGYKLTANLTINSGTGITIAHTDVLIDLNGFDIEYGVTGFSEAINPGNVTGWEVYNGSLSQGAFLGLATGRISAIHRNGQVGNDFNIRDIVFNLKDGGNVAGLTLSAIVFANQVSALTLGEISNCTFNCVGGNGLIAININGDVFSGSIHDNTFTFTGVSKGNVTRPAAISNADGTEMYKNIIAADANTEEFQGFQIFNTDDGYIHDNAFNLGIKQGRAIGIDEADSWTVLHNTIDLSLPQGDPSDGSIAAIRYRFGSSNCYFGHNTVTGTADDEVRAFFVGGLNDPSTVKPFNGYFYSNTVDVNGTALRFQGGTSECHFWGNSWDGGEFAMLLQADDVTGDNSVNDVDLSGDVFAGDISFVTLTASNQTITSNFELWNGTFGGGDTYTKSSFVLDNITAFKMTGTAPFPVAKTPNAPANLRQI